VAEDIRVENVICLSFEQSTFDAVWSRGVLHATGDTQKAVDEIHRVLKPGGIAIISHFYRKPSWMFWLSKYGKENIEFKEEDPPVNDFLTEKEILLFFKDFEIVELARDHYQALPTVRTGTKAFLYNNLFRPIYNLTPEGFSKKLAYKFSVTAKKPIS
jgi:SAM-dependent methyltransferase